MQSGHGHSTGSNNGSTTAVPRSGTPEDKAAMTQREMSSPPPAEVLTQREAIMTLADLMHRMKVREFLYASYEPV